MPSLRAIRLLNAVEAGTTNGTQFQNYLTDAGRLAEFNVLLSMRGSTRRIASNPTTMGAVVISPAAINAIFGAASASNSTASQAVANSPVAMTSVSTSLNTLNTVNANPVSWSQFIASPSYGTNAKNIIATLAGVTPTLYATADALITDPVSMGLIVASPRGMSALVASPSTVATMAGNSPAMAVVAANPIAIATVATNTSIMPTIANSSAAMTEIISRTGAMSSMTVNPGAIRAIFASAGGWAAMQTSPFFNNYLLNIVGNLAGLNLSSYGTLNDVIGSSTAMTSVAQNSGAMQALSASSTAMTTLASSSNFGIVANSSVAMNVLTANNSAISGLIANTTSLATMFGSSTAKGAMFTSNNAVNAISASASAQSWLRANKMVLAFSTTVPNAIGRVGAFDPFGAGVPAKVLLLAVRQAGISVIVTTDFQFGTAVAGSVAGQVVGGAGIAALDTVSQGTPHVATYSNLTVKTAAAVIAITGVAGVQYVDMT